MAVDTGWSGWEGYSGTQNAIEVLLSCVWRENDLSLVNQVISHTGFESPVFDQREELPLLPPVE